MGKPRCVLIGAGRVAGGFIVPLLSDAGWETILICRSAKMLAALNQEGGLQLRITGEPPTERWISSVRGVPVEDPRLPEIVAGADLLATAVGPSALPGIGRWLAPALRYRLDVARAPINILTFENHLSAPELLLSGLLEGCPSLAREIGRRLGFGGVVVWRLASHREITDGIARFHADSVGESYAGSRSLIAGVPPLDGTVPSIQLAESFRRRMCEKLWVFNAGHVAAAYLGWRAGCRYVHEAMAHPAICDLVRAVLSEAQQGFQAYLARHPSSTIIPTRPAAGILARYSDPALGDSVVRVAREPRRKLAADDRLLGPALACFDAGMWPIGLATTAAAALAYAEPSDPQAVDLQRELALLPPEEVLSAVSGLDPGDELAHLIGDCYRAQAAEAHAA